MNSHLNTSPLQTSIASLAMVVTIVMKAYIHSSKLCKKVGEKAGPVLVFLCCCSKKLRHRFIFCVCITQFFPPIPWWSCSRAGVICLQWEL